MKITLLGTGTPAPSLTRQSSGYVFEIANDVIVIDHGPGAHQRLLEAGYRASDVTHCFLTHYHYDHMMDYPRLVLTRWDHGAPGTAPLRVYGPDPLKEINDRFIGLDGAFALDIAARINSPASIAVYKARGGTGERKRPEVHLQQITPGDKIKGDGWMIQVGPARHVQPDLNCLSYRVTTNEGSVVYSGDNGGIYAPFIEFAKDADVLIHMNHSLSDPGLPAETQQMSGRHLDVAETARQAGARMLVLTHLLPMLDMPGVKERMVSEMSALYPNTIVVGEDLMKIPLITPPIGIAD